MEFAGKEYIYLSKLKKEKIKNIRKSEEENKDEAPGIKEEEPKKEDEKNEEKKKDEKENEIKEDEKHEKEEPKKENGKDENFIKFEENDGVLSDEISSKLGKYINKKRKRKLSKDSNISPVSDDAKLSVCSGNFNMDFLHLDFNSYDEDPAPMQKNGHIYRKEIDTNICVIHCNELANDSENIILKTYQCIKC